MNINSANTDYVLIKPSKDYPGKRYMKGNYCYEHHYIWWKNTGEILKKNETIHHINGNKKDNRFENLEKLTRNKHSSKYHRRAEIGLFECPICGKKFERERRKVKHLMNKNRPVFCSRICGGKVYGKGKDSSKCSFKVIEWVNSADVSE